MNALILNRDFQHPADGWYMIEPKGDHANRAAGIVQVIDDAAAQSIVNRFAEEAAKPNFPGMLIDHEHFKHDQEKETIAYGWLMGLQNRADGIYGQVRWTATGKAAVDGGDYRFFSTEYDAGELRALNAERSLQTATTGNAEQKRRVRPLRLDGLTLTNAPNNKGGRPITNRGQRAEGGGQEDEFRQERGAPAGNQQKTKGPMKTVCTRLGLSADASEEAVLAAVEKLTNRAEITAPELVTLRNRATELETKVTKLESDQIEADWNRVKNRYKPEEHEAAKKQLIANREGFMFNAERLPVLTDGHRGEQQQQRQRTVINRDAGARTATTAATATAVTPAQLNAEVRKIMNRDGIKDFTAAFNALQQEKPELFEASAN
jgi:hypothetical protein